MHLLFKNVESHHRDPKKQLLLGKISFLAKLWHSIFGVDTLFATES
jgi:hypothetical protein